MSRDACSLASATGQSVVSPSPRSPLGDVHAVLQDQLPSGPVEIYEAGGGSTSYLPADILQRARITVVDIDAHQIAGNEYGHALIQGDIQTYRFPTARFDLIVCYNVIEHVPDVAAAFEGFVTAVKPGGMILIGAPNPSSLSGFVTRWTPHWFHVWFCRHMLGWATAGQPGSPPFPTLFHPLVDPDRLSAFATARGFDLIHRRLYESPRYAELRSRTPLFAAALDRFADALDWIRGRGSNVRNGDYHLIFRRRP